MVVVAVVAPGGTQELRHADALSVLLQFKQGNMGLVLGRRGAAVPKVPCCWGCGLIADRATLAGGHESNECPKRFVRCRNAGCHVELLQAWEQEQHESEFCPQRCATAAAPRLVACCCFFFYQYPPLPSEAARALLLPSLFNPHQATFPLVCTQPLQAYLFYPRNLHPSPNACAHDPFGAAAAAAAWGGAGRSVDCPLGCGARLRRSAMAPHVDVDCELRTVGCALGCGHAARARDVGRHEERDCPHRLVECKLMCHTPVSGGGGGGASASTTSSTHRQQQHLEHGRGGGRAGGRGPPSWAT